MHVCFTSDLAHPSIASSRFRYDLAPSTLETTAGALATSTRVGAFQGKHLVLDLHHALFEQWRHDNKTSSGACSCTTFPQHQVLTVRVVVGCRV